MKFYSCSVGEKDKGYDEENLNRIVEKKAFILHENTPQKGTYNAIKQGDILLLKYRSHFIAYGKANEIFTSDDEEWNLTAPVEEWYFFDQSNKERGIHIYGMKEATLSGSQYGTVKPLRHTFSFNTIKRINKNTDLFNSIISEMNKMDTQEKLDILKYKKQIILQGPPGTGKTREAKLIAKELIGNNSKISEKNIFSFFTINQEISARKESTKYIIKEINQDSILLSTNGEDRSPTRKQIYDSYIGKLWEKSSEERKSNTLSYADALAKNLFNRFNDLKNNDQIKLIQFHPSYTYEDFVRGIVAESKGEKIEYKNVNKTLGEFAELALKNYHKSTKSDSILSKNEWVNEQFDNFVETVQSKIDDTGEYRLTDKVKLFDIDESAFYYTGDSWFESAKHRMKFSDIKEAFLSDPADKKAFKALANISGSAKQHYGYYYKVFSDFKNSITTKFEEVDTAVREPENFVLIIDEINRANLSSVLGELIYALEYRGEEVESMYSVDDSLLKNKLILPPNLYIIGTMNTADRSVGHIDYAIRRRFAFIEVLPKDLTAEMKEGEFYTDLFSEVKALFTKDDYQTKSDFLSQEFEPKDVALGHSYFIDKTADGGDIKTRWNYEIKPILLEYIRDGVLKETALKQVISIETTLDMRIQ
ncbi:AAA family ATPase [Chryseobacterium sp. PBS4-4]|uniref:AAA family ATPase n=1 Tax=Chryseobacterium edaphi TaxID=2976532 RepID=A0ABT2W3R4_9FLAO|nr:AAA family ATPase [Chryseobacterium edaphi]MCU7616848.1 AAA family ATPase [Chryseobacterium edaphi]